MPTRIAALWLALILLLAQGVDGFGVHPCELHGPAADSGGAAHAMHMAQGAGSHQGSDSHAPCTCTGVCCAPAALSLPSAPVASVAALVTRVAVEPTGAAPALRSLHQPYLLPYGQAPPPLA